MNASSVDQLNQTFANVKGVRFEAGEGGLTRLAINAPVASAHIYLHGAHVTHFQPTGEMPVLFLSSKSAFAPGKAIRGGIPVIFPWFGPRASDNVMHGFVRTREWGVESIEPKGDAVVATLKTESDSETSTLWPYRFTATLVVTVGKALDVVLRIENRSAEAFEFEEALHTYYEVGDVQKVRVLGLQNAGYHDKVLDHARALQHDEIIHPTGPIDRVYVNTPATCTIEDPALARKIIIEKSGSQSTVVWNAWAENMPKFADFPPDAWLHYMCVETANAKDNVVTLKASGVHEMRMSVHVEPLK